MPSQTVNFTYSFEKRNAAAVVDVKPPLWSKSLLKVLFGVFTCLYAPLATDRQLSTTLMQTSISSGAPVPRALRCLTRHRRLTASRTHNKRPFSSSNRPPKKVLAPPKATSSPAQPAPEQPEEGTRAPNGSDLQSVSHSSPSTAESGSFGKRIKRFFGGDRLDRKRLQALGLGAVASYGFVSNATYGTGLAISWVTFVRQTGMDNAPIQHYIALAP